jgi:hypothetical protein
VSSPIVIAGDPHGNFSPILRACIARHAGTLILLGDCDLSAPLSQTLAPLLTLGWQVRWIIGNKDAETETAFDNLATDYPEGDIGGRRVQAAHLVSARRRTERPDRAAQLQHAPRVPRQFEAA